MAVIRSASFDTSFLLRDGNWTNKVIRKLIRDNVRCFITSTVLSELEALRINGRIDKRQFGGASSRWKRTGAEVIDHRNEIVRERLGRECEISMSEHLGSSEGDVRNDCRILVTGLKKGVDLFLSEDFHFKSHLTEAVLEEITEEACREYGIMCGSSMLAMDAYTFLKVYDAGVIDEEALEAMHDSDRRYTTLRRGHTHQRT